MVLATENTENTESTERIQVEMRGVPVAQCIPETRLVTGRHTGLHWIEDNFSCGKHGTDRVKGKNSFHAFRVFRG
jgi:hypothetical protein